MSAERLWWGQHAPFVERHRSSRHDDANAVGGFDMVVAADVIYEAAQVAPLVATVRQTCATLQTRQTDPIAHHSRQKCK